jgi:hypothetical protein
VLDAPRLVVRRERVAARAQVVEHPVHLVVARARERGRGLERVSDVLEGHGHPERAQPEGRLHRHVEVVCAHGHGLELARVAALPRRHAREQLARVARGEARERRLAGAVCAAPRGLHQLRDRRGGAEHEHLRGGGQVYARLEAARRDHRAQLAEGQLRAHEAALVGAHRAVKTPELHARGEHVAQGLRPALGARARRSEDERGARTGGDGARDRGQELARGPPGRGEGRVVLGRDELDAGRARGLCHEDPGLGPRRPRDPAGEHVRRVRGGAQGHAARARLTVKREEIS